MVEGRRTVTAVGCRCRSCLAGFFAGRRHQKSLSQSRRHQEVRRDAATSIDPRRSGSGVTRSPVKENRGLSAAERPSLRAQIALVRRQPERSVSCGEFIHVERVGIASPGGGEQCGCGCPRKRGFAAFTEWLADLFEQTYRSWGMGKRVCRDLKDVTKPASVLNCEGCARAARFAQGPE